MRSVLAIDPGKNAGWARFVDGDLCEAEVMNGSDIVNQPPPIAVGPAIVVIEIPVIYPIGRGKGDPNDLISLAIMAGRLSGYYKHICNCDTIFVKPRVWKGTVPKRIHQKRILDKLKENEKAKLPHQNHNMVDAIGIGLWYLEKNDERK